MHPLVIEPDTRPAVATVLRERHPEVPLVEPDTPDAVPTALAEADGPTAFLCRNSRWRESYLDGLSAGDWVFTKTTGYERYPVEAFDERGVVFSNCPGLTAEPVADHALALLLAVSRDLRTYHDQQRERDWTQHPGPMTDFVGAECCVVGAGRIGDAVARRLRGLGMTVRGVKRDTAGYEGPVEDLYPAEELGDALSGARVAVLTVPLTPATRGLIGAAELSRVADDAVVVNVCRGPVLETAALVEALEAGELRGAGVDVVDERPPPSSWPLWDREDVVVTPHVAGKSDRTPERLVDRLMTSYERWVDGRDPEARVV